MNVDSVQLCGLFSSISVFAFGYVCIGEALPSQWGLWCRWSGHRGSCVDVEPIVSISFNSQEVMIKFTSFIVAVWGPLQNAHVAGMSLGFLHSAVLCLPPHFTHTKDLLQ